MASDTVLGGVLAIFERLGVYDVILPFLLTFTVVFAILEKTRVLGTDKIDGKDYPKKSLNAMVAFCLGFFVIASAQLVAVVTQVSAEMVIVLLMGVFFLMMIGTFYKPGEVYDNLENWPKYFGYLFFIAILVMFARAIPYSSNQSLLDYGMSFIGSAANSSTVAAFLLIGIIIFFMMWITGEDK